MADIERDRFGRPMIIPPGETKSVAYTRASTFANTLNDAGGLIDWKVRLVADGLSIDDDLMYQWRHAMSDPDKKLIAAQALDRAGGSAKADAGTAVHDLCASIAQGMLVRLPEEYAHQVGEWLRLTAGWEWISVEELGVDDALRVAGTWDGIARLPDGSVRVVDIKTGTVHAMQVEMQLALYQGMVPYAPVASTWVRKPRIETADDYGVVIHLPAGKPGTLYRANLSMGRQAIEMAQAVRMRRKGKLMPFAVEEVVEVQAPIPLIDLIEACTTTDELTSVWRANRARWDGEANGLATAKKFQLQGATK